MRSSILRISMIILLYCAAISFFLLGVGIFYEEQAEKKSFQEKTAYASSENTSSHSILFLPEKQNLQKKQTLQRNIAKNVIRLHIKANSNSTKDQILKLHVRNAILTGLQSCLKHSSSREQAEREIITKLSEIKETARCQLEKEGCSYPVKVSLSDRLFPNKQYGDLTFPAGIYRSLCIDIGSAGGHNWWCVLFPSLCFVDETTAQVPEESKEKLKNSLTEEEYKLLSEPPKAHSLFFDWFTDSP